MSLPAKSGVIIYSKNIKTLSQFYRDMFDMDLLRETPDFISLGCNGFNIIIHVPPIEIPPNNFNTVKVFLTVDSHTEAMTRVVECGGEVLAGVWANPLFKVCNISDPEGNHIQIREFTQ